jgi:uncharacterized protein
MKYPRSILTILFFIVIVGLTFSSVLVHVFTESWWFDAVGFAEVFWTRLSWEIGVWVAIFAVYLAAVLGNYALSMHLTRDRIFRVLVESERWNPRNDALPTWIATGVAIALAFIAATSSVGTWETILQFLNPSEFAIADPIYAQDVGFYFFRLPFYEWLQQALLSLGLWSLVVSVAVYSLKGELTIGRGWQNIITGSAKVHVALLLAAIAICVTFGFWLERYELLYSAEGVVFGAGYTDVHAQLHAYWFMGVATLGLMVLFILSLWQRNFALPVFGLGIYLIMLVLVNGIYPWFQQQFVVEPNELEKELPYITNGIEFTRAAYHLDAVESQDYVIDNALDQPALERNESTIRNIRLWDYRPLLSTYRQLQEIRLYYRFLDVDVDRYTLDDLYQQVMLAPRELDYRQVPDEAQTWVNQHLKYTHGYGIVASPVNRVTTNGLPEFLVQDIPPVSKVDDLEVQQPRIYYGEKTDEYVFTGTTTDEFDFPQNNGNATNRYSGAGGVALRSLLRRLTYAFDLGDLKILISGYMNDESKILYHRPIQERIRQVAPFLRYDDDPYATLINGRVKWIVDAYTVSDRYPYSEPVARSNNFAASFQDSRIGRILRPRTNYIRNSVKVVVDAYDGSMQFYVIDDSDPVLNTYRQIFPGLFTDGSAVPPETRSHFRYPVDFFKIQAQVYSSYHMDNPEEFYNREDLWRFPMEIYDSQPQVMEPYYVIMRLPEAEQDEFILILPFTPVNKDNMIAWIAARSDGAEYGNLLLYEFPKQELIYGPSQIEARIDQNPEISQQLTLWSQEGSRVIRGDLLVIPIERSLLYVEPIYLRAEQGELPELRRVIMSYNNQTVMEPSLEAAIAAIFGDRQPDSSNRAAPSNVLSPLAQQALDAYQNAQQALQDGDWATYGRYQQELGELLEQLNQSVPPPASAAPAQPDEPAPDGARI